VAEPLTLPRIVERLDELVRHARGLELAICGSVSTEPGEQKALNKIAEMLVDAVTELHDEIDAQLEAERGKQ
jgi:hypothetical protein